MKQVTSEMLKMPAKTDITFICKNGWWNAI